MTPAHQRLVDLLAARVAQRGRPLTRESYLEGRDWMRRLRARQREDPEVFAIATTRDELRLVLLDGREMAVPWAEASARLAKASPAEQDGFVVSEDGRTISWPGLHVGLSVAGLAADFGNRTKRLGRKRRRTADEAVVEFHEPDSFGKNDTNRAPDAHSGLSLQ